MTNETTKPVVTQADELERGKDELRRLMDSIWRAEYRNDAPNWQPLDDLPGMVSQIDNMYAGVRSQRDEARWALHNPPTPSEPSVVSQDLVEQIARAIADYDDGLPETWMSEARAILPIIEAAQIAARNEALDEAARVASDGETLHRRGDSKDWRDGYETACNYIAAALLSLRAPSQHQEEQ